MKILIICSKAFYDRIASIKGILEEKGYEIYLPNSYNNPKAEREAWDKGDESHAEFKARMFKMSEERIKEMDAVLVLNYEKNGIENYIGGSTFLEMYEAFKNKKKIYMYHDIPKGILFDEIDGFSPILIKEDLEKIK